MVDALIRIAPTAGMPYTPGVGVVSVASDTPEGYVENRMAPSPTNHVEEQHDDELDHAVGTRHDVRAL